MNKDSEIKIHVFPNVPPIAGLPCHGEDSKCLPGCSKFGLKNIGSIIESIYRRGARRWRKLYRVNGHIFQAKRFNRVRFNLHHINYIVLLIFLFFPPFCRKHFAHIVEIVSGAWDGKASNVPIVN